MPSKIRFADGTNGVHVAVRLTSEQNAALEIICHNTGRTKTSIISTLVDKLIRDVTLATPIPLPLPGAEPTPEPESETAKPAAKRRTNPK